MCWGGQWNFYCTVKNGSLATKFERWWFFLLWCLGVYFKAKVFPNAEVTERKKNLSWLCTVHKKSLRGCGLFKAENESSPKPTK